MWEQIKFYRREKIIWDLLAGEKSNREQIDGQMRKQWNSLVKNCSTFDVLEMGNAADAISGLPLDSSRHLLKDIDEELIILGL